MDLAWQELPPALRVTPRRNDQLLLPDRGVRLRVAMPQQPDYALFVARFVAPEPQEQPPGDFLVIPRAPHPDPVWDAAVLTMLLPASMVPPDPTFLPGGPSGRLVVPWRQDPLTSLLLPDETLRELWMDRSYADVCCNVTPGEFGPVFKEPDVDAVAWAVLLRCPSEPLVAVLAALAFRADILGVASALDRAITEALTLPDQLQARLRGAVRGGRPLLDARCLRWIIRELAAAAATGQGGSPPRWEPASLAQEALARVLFPATLQAEVALPPANEVLRAVWLAHEGFKLGEEAADELDRAMSIVAASTFGLHHAPAMLRFLDRGRRILEVDDAHPAVTGASPAPSALRAAFAQASGLTTSQWLRGASILAVRYLHWVVNDRPHLATLDQLMELNLPVRLSTSLRGLIERELLTTVTDLGQAVLAEMRKRGIPYTGVGSTPKPDSQPMRDRPLLRLDDGNLHPVGLGLLLDRIVDLPRRVMDRSRAVGGYRVVRAALGRQFQAYVTDRVAQTRSRHQILTEQQITAILGTQAKRGDAIIGNGGDYLLVEASTQSLGDKVAAGDPTSIASKCDDYHAKADQAEAMASGLSKLVRAYDLPSVRSSTSLVVTDKAMPTSPALAAALRRARPGRNPRFVCSIEEFELLLDAGARWSIPLLVQSWQADSWDQPLGAHLGRKVLWLTPLDGRDTEPFGDDWLSELPSDPQVA